MRSKLARNAGMAAAGGLAVAGGIALTGALLGAYALRRARSSASAFRGQVVLITGGSRGLGLAMAEEFARQGARVAICARDQEELARAESRVRSLGADVLATTCDVGNREQVENLIRQVTERFGRIDVLVNNAGIISVGPIDAQRVEDFEESMQIMFWGPLYATLAVLPQMRERRAGRIVNITSIGGKVSVPHLAPYNCAKFAHVGLSEGLRAELRKHGIRVTTVVPGLMRTGSHINAQFKGQQQSEYTLFSLMGTSPLTSISAARAARSVVRAAARGDSEVILSVPAKLMVLAHGVAPGLNSDLLGYVDLMLPRGHDDSKRPGHESETAVSRSFLTWLGQRAARRYNQRGEIAA